MRIFKEIPDRAAAGKNPEAADPARVFVVHGRNDAVRREFFTFLRSLGLSPTEWGHAIRDSRMGAPSIGQVLDAAFANATAVLVLLTGDDLALLQEEFRHAGDPPFEAALTPQARPNVLFEAGMALGRKPDRTIIVEVGLLRPFSDLAGRHTVRFTGDIASRHELAKRLEDLGCTVNLRGSDWQTSGDFAAVLSSADSVTPSVIRADDKMPGTNLAEEEVQILDCLARAEASGQESLTSGDISSELKIPLPRTKHFIHVLEEERRLLFGQYSDWAEPSYSLAAEGRAVLIKLGRI